MEQKKAFVFFTGLAHFSSRWWEEEVGAGRGGSDSGDSSGLGWRPAAQDGAGAPQTCCPPSLIRGVWDSEHLF